LGIRKKWEEKLSNIPYSGIWINYSPHASLQNLECYYVTGESPLYSLKGDYYGKKS
jgi:hypothetical protein